MRLMTDAYELIACTIEAGFWSCSIFFLQLLKFIAVVWYYLKLRQEGKLLLFTRDNGLHRLQFLFFSLSLNRRQQVVFYKHSSHFCA